MPEEILEIQTEQEHNGAVEKAKEREEKIHEAIEKIVSTIEELTEDPPADAAVSEFATTLPMAPQNIE